mgnify:CR=1 FL=1
MTSMRAWMEALVSRQRGLTCTSGRFAASHAGGRAPGRARRSRPHPEMADSLLRELIRPDLHDQFQQTNEADFAYSLPGVGGTGSTPSASAARSGWCCGGVQERAMSIGELGLPR